MQNGVILATNVSGAQTTTAVSWTGGHTALVMVASAYDGTTGFLQLLGPSGTAVNINGTHYSANQCTLYDLPAGMYQLSLGASTSALYAVLVLVPYS
jgi:hypothetical protein